MHILSEARTFNIIPNYCASYSLPVAQKIEMPIKRRKKYFTFSSIIHLSVKKQTQIIGGAVARRCHLSDIVKSYRSIFEASFIIITTKFLCLSLIFFVAAAALEREIKIFSAKYSEK